MFRPIEPDYLAVASYTADLAVGQHSRVPDSTIHADLVSPNAASGLQNILIKHVQLKL